MELLTCLALNAPLLVLSLLANVFYAACLLRPVAAAPRVRQPLRLLLLNLVGCSLTYQLTLVIMMAFELARQRRLFHLTYLVSACSLYTSMASAVWLNFFYYSQIVPAQTALFVWVKKHIKPLIYGLWFLDRFYTLVGFFILGWELPIFEARNATSEPGAERPALVSASALLGGLEALKAAVEGILKTHFFSSTAVMVMSCGTTSLYLCKHLRRMMALGRPLLSHRFKGHVRVTVSGAAQGVLYLMCAMWMGFNLDSTKSLVVLNNVYTHYTIVMFYTFCTTVTLGLGQSLFRQRAAHIWGLLSAAGPRPPPPPPPRAA